MIYANREACEPPDEIFHSLLCLDFGLFRYDSFGLHFLNGFDMIIMNGENPETLYDLCDGIAVGTRFIGKKVVV